MAQGHAERGIIRILKSRPGKPSPVGAGFLISARHALTCAHVVNQALGRDEYASDQPSSDLFLDLPVPAQAAPPGSEGLPERDQGPLSVRVVAWHPPREKPQPGNPSDIAVLMLESPCGEENVLPLLRADSPVAPGYQGYAYGFPGRGGSGIWAKGELSGHQHFGWRQIADVGGTAIAAGFSGGPFLDAEQERVIGMVVARHSRFPVSYLIPVETLFQAWAELERVARQVDMPDAAAPRPDARTTTDTRAEQHQNVNVNVNIALPEAPPAAAETGQTPPRGGPRRRP